MMCIGEVDLSFAMCARADSSRHHVRSRALDACAAAGTPTVRASTTSHSTIYTSSASFLRYRGASRVDRATYARLTAPSAPVADATVATPQPCASTARRLGTTPTQPTARRTIKFSDINRTLFISNNKHLRYARDGRPPYGQPHAAGSCTGTPTRTGGVTWVYHTANRLTPPDPAARARVSCTLNLRCIRNTVPRMLYRLLSEQCRVHQFYSTYVAVPYVRCVRPTC